MKNLFCFIIAIAFSNVFYGQIITTTIGTGTSGYNGDNIMSNSARIYYANSVVLDKTNSNIYIADCYNHRIRKVDINSNIITTVVGTGTAGYNGDNILATNAQINGPSSRIAFDSAGNYYFGDFYNNRIRKVDIATGMISTIAGTGVGGYNGDSILAINAQLYHPEGVAIDNNSNIYFADNANHRIRKINSATGIITTVAGNGNGGYNGDSILATSASLKFPTNVALDSNQNVIIPDWQNHRVRKVNINSGLITTIVGNGTGVYNGDSIIATSASVSTPVDVAFDSQWNLYIASEFNYRIRKISSVTGIITTVAGNGNAGYNGDSISAVTAKLNFPTGVFVDYCQNLFIADPQNNRIRKVWFNTDTLPQVSATITPNDTVIIGTQITTTATATNHGTVTSYQWIKNGVSVGATNSTYTYTPVNGDSVYCIMTVRACTGRLYTDTTTTIHITVNSGVGVANTTNYRTHTYPNPVTDVLHVATTEALHYVLHNLIGIAILQGTIDKNNSIDMKAIPAGTYLLQLTDADGQREVIRVVKE